MTEIWTEECPPFAPPERRETYYALWYYDKRHGGGWMQWHKYKTQRAAERNAEQFTGHSPRIVLTEVVTRYGPSFPASVRTGGEP